MLRRGNVLISFRFFCPIFGYGELTGMGGAA